ncbi:hypothetical protein [Burkholderia cepacia]|uniref:hypothetical protein n=1 Tax=Burkholderia cepacia TaxID=292 RepID=UPI00398F664E
MRTTSICSTDGHGVGTDLIGSADAGEPPPPTEAARTAAAMPSRLSALPAMKRDGTAAAAGPSASRRRSRTPLSGSRASSAPISPGAIASGPDAIALRAIRAGSFAPVDQREARVMLEELERLNHQLTTSLARATDCHRRVRDELARSDHRCLAEDNIRKLDELQQFVVTAGPVKALLESLVGGHQSDPAVESTGVDAGASSGSNATQRRIALAEMFGAIAAKNAAWYALPGIIPASHVSFNDVGRMTALVAQRSALAMLVAAATEYPLATDAQRRFKDAGGQINQLQGFAQSLDQALALLILFATNKASGQEAPPAYQVAGFALTAAGAAFQTGALNGLIIRMLRPIFDTVSGKSPRPDEAQFVLVDTSTLRANPVPTEQGEIQEVDRSTADPEQGTAHPSRGNRPDSRPDALLDAVPAQDLQQMRSDLANACTSVARLHDAIFPREDETIPADATPAPHPADYEALVERLGHDIVAIQASIRRLRSELPDGDERLARIDAALEHARDVERTIADMPERSTAKRTAFFASMAVLSTIGSVLGAIGPSIQNAWLSDIKHRAAIFGVTSSVLQAFANLGQFLGGAKPGDGRLARFLKIGLEHENNPYRAWVKNWLRSVRFLLGEFPLLQLSTTFSEMANREAAKSPHAPVQGTPSAYTIRNVQETFRAILSLAFTALALGEKASWNHYLGLGITALGAIVPTAIERANAAR